MEESNYWMSNVIQDVNGNIRYCMHVIWSEAILALCNFTLQKVSARSSPIYVDSYWLYLRMQLF